jgi:hypothetical protein
MSMTKEALEGVGTEIENVLGPLILMNTAAEIFVHEITKNSSTQSKTS